MVMIACASVSLAQGRVDVRFEGGSMDGQRFRLDVDAEHGSAGSTDLAATVKERGKDLAEGAQLDQDKLAGAGALLGGLVGDTWVTTISASRPAAAQDAAGNALTGFSMRLVGRGQLKAGGRYRFTIGTEIKAGDKKLEPVVTIVEEETSVGPLKMKVPKPRIEGDFRIDEIDAEGYAVGRAKGPFTINGKDDDVTNLNIRFRVKADGAEVEKKDEG